MPTNRVTLELGGLPSEDGYIELADFLGALQQFKSALANADLATSHGRSVKLRVVELSMKSPATIGIEVVPLNPREDYSDDITSTFFAASQNQLDPTRSEAALGLINAVTTIASMVGKKIAHAEFKNSAHKVALTPELRSEVVRVLAPEYTTRGTIRGRLEFINLHSGANKFRIYPRVGSRRLICRFPVERLEEAVAAVNKTVAVTGTLTYRQGSLLPSTIDVTNIQVLRPDDELPFLSRLRGVAPDATDGMKSEDFVRKLRDGWHD